MSSRIVSFVLGFSLASLIAWIGAMPAGEIVATEGFEARETAVEPVVTSSPLVAPAVPAPAPVPPPALTQRKTEAQPPRASSVAPAVSAAPSAAPRSAAAPSATARPGAASSAVPARAAAPAATNGRRPVPSGYRGVLVLNSNPEGAQVLLNGRVVGQTPVVLNDVPAGSGAVTVRRDGYAPWSASVRIVANQRTPVRATLKPLAQSGG